MKIIQLNIWMGQLLYPALTFIDGEAPDVLCVQEVQSAKNGYGLFSTYQTHERLAERFPYNYFAPTFSFEVLGEVCEYGNAIYSQHPLSDEQVEFTVGAYREKATIADFKEQGEIRNIQTCKVSPEGGKPFYIANHHGYHISDSTGDGNTGSEASMRNVATRLKKIEGPLVFCGDLNVNPQSKTIHELDSLGLRNLTVENGLDTTLSKAHRFSHDLVSDYIFISQGLKPKSFRSSDDLVSDHKALVLEFEP